MFLLNHLLAHVRAYCQVIQTSCWFFVLFSLTAVTVCDPKRLSPIPLVETLGDAVRAGITLKSGGGTGSVLFGWNKLFHKLKRAVGGGGGEEGPPSKKSSIVGIGGDAPPRPARSGPLSPPLLLSLLLLLLLLCLSKRDFSLSLSNLFLIWNSFPGWLGKDSIKSLSDCFFLMSISLRRLPTIGFSASNVEMILSPQNILAYWI